MAATAGVGRFVARALARSVRELAPYALLAAGVFVAAAALGGAVGVGNGTTDVVPVREGGDAVADPAAPALLVHNAVVAVELVAGAALAGLPTLYLLGYNGFLVGAVLVEAAGGLGPVVAVALLAPHGVVELPAVWLAGAAGFRLTHGVWRVATGDRRGPGFPRHLLDGLVGLGVALVLFAVAAWVEAAVTVPPARALAG